MQVGINSQTMRVIDEGVVTDYHMPDGSSSSFMMKFAHGYVKPIRFIIHKTFCDYESQVVSEDTPMSWGSATDKMTGNKMMDITGEISNSNLEQFEERYCNEVLTPVVGVSRFGGVSMGGMRNQPVKMTMMSNPTSKTSANYEAFKSLFR